MYYILVGSGHFVFAIGIRWLKLKPAETDKHTIDNRRRLEKTAKKNNHSWKNTSLGR